MGSNSAWRLYSIKFTVPTSWQSLFLQWRCFSFFFTADLEEQNETTMMPTNIWQDRYFSHTNGQNWKTLTFPKFYYRKNAMSWTSSTLRSTERKTNKWTNKLKKKSHWQKSKTSVILCTNISPQMSHLICLGRASDSECTHSSGQTSSSHP